MPPLINDLTYNLQVTISDPHIINTEFSIEGTCDKKWQTVTLSFLD